jgi:nucleoside-diphosphate-sugar epimerase
MRLLLTGASGFIGRNLLERAPRDWDIVAVYNGATDFPGFIEGKGLRHVRPVRCDLTVPSEVRALRAEAGDADGALYLAANGDPAASAHDPLRDLQLNTVALLTFLEHCPVPSLVYLSSGAVYDGLSGEVSPASRVEPRLPYAISKLAAEHYVQSYAVRREMPASFVNVRFFGAYGPYEPLRKITTRFLAAVKRGDRRFPLRGDGRNLIDFMHVDDAVDGLLTLLTVPRDARLTVDFASGHPVTIGDVVHAMVAITGSDIAIEYEGATAEYIEFRSGDRAMAERFGVVPQISFEDGFRRLQAFLAEHEHAAVRG